MTYLKIRRNLERFDLEMLELRSVLGCFSLVDDENETRVSIGMDNVLVVESIETSCCLQLNDVDQEEDKRMDEKTFENWTWEEQEVDW